MFEAATSITDGAAERLKCWTLAVQQGGASTTRPKGRSKSQRREGTAQHGAAQQGATQYKAAHAYHYLQAFPVRAVVPELRGRPPRPAPRALRLRAKVTLTPTPFGPAKPTHAHSCILQAGWD